MNDSVIILRARDSVLNGKALSAQDAMTLSTLKGPAIYELFSAAGYVKAHYRGDFIALCSIMSVRAGGCSEDCSFCAQSAVSTAKVERYPLKTSQDVSVMAASVKEAGSLRFSIVTAGKTLNAGKFLNNRDAIAIGDMIAPIKKANLKPCASLGLLDKETLLFLKTAGLDRYHHNLESSGEFFPSICTTHSYADKLKTIEATKEAGLSLCSGGIFGMGESWQDRINMATLIRDIEANSVPINFLTPIVGTPLAAHPLLDPLEALKIISIYRLMLPDKEIRVCGGRMHVLGDFNAFIFAAGACSLMIGNYLTTSGRDPSLDRLFIEKSGLCCQSTGNEMNRQ